MVSKEIRNFIKKECRIIEKEEGVDILFCVENGSRAWRMSSKDSDYDVRFVFAHQVKDYLALKKPKEVLERFFDEQRIKMGKSEGSFIDMVGFDIFKYLGLLGRSNPTAIEWLVTDIVYYGRQSSELKRLVKKNFNPRALYYHYRSLCRNNYQKYILSDKDVSYKKYLYIIRGLTNAKWVANKKMIPLISLTKTIKELKKLGVLPKRICESGIRIIEKKKKGLEKEQISRIKLIDDYVNRFLLKETEEKEAPEVKRGLDEKELTIVLRKLIPK